MGTSNISVNHDCIVAFSGGVESTALLCHVVKQGMNPLVIHVEVGMGWRQQSECADLIASNLDVDLRYIEYVNEHPLTDKQKLLDHYFDLGIHPPFFFTWCNIMQMVNVNNPHIHKIYFGFNASNDKQMPYAEEHQRSIERVLNLINIPTKMSAPLGHMTKKEQWDSIPKHLQKYVHSCVHSSKRACGKCSKCTEFLHISENK